MSYITEAFRQLKMLNEEDFNITDKGITDELRSFVDDDIEIEDDSIIDTEARTEDELQNSYVGKVILECACCHTRIYKDIENVVIDEETGLANIDEECPVCSTMSGYNAIGKIEAFSAEEAETEDELLDSEGEVDEFEDEFEDDDFDDEEFGEALHEAMKALKEQKDLGDDVCPECGHNPCKCKKESCHEEMLDHGNTHKEFKADGGIASDDTKSLEDDQTDLVHAADEKIPALNEAKDTDYDEANDVMTEKEALAYWAENHDSDPVLFDYVDEYGENAREVWLKDSRANGYIKNESLEDDQTDLVHAADEKIPALTEGVNPATGEDDLELAIEDPGIRPNYELDDGIEDESLEEAADLNKLADEDKEALENPESMVEGVTVDVNNKTITTDSDDVNVDLNAGTVEVGAAEETFEDGEEVIEPLSDEDMASIESNVPEDELGEPEDILGDETEEPIEDEISDEEIDADVEDDLGLDADTEEEPVEDEVAEESFDFREFDESLFNSTCTRYLKKVYENVNDFTATVARELKGSLVVEGTINFKSGNSKKTEFVFESSKVSKRGKTVIEGYNKTFSNSKKAFSFKGSIVDNKFMTESMIYNYTTKQINESNEAEPVRVYGRVIA